MRIEARRAHDAAILTGVFRGEKPARRCPRPAAASHAVTPISGAMPSFQGMGEGNAVLPMLEGRGQPDMLGGTPLCAASPHAGAPKPCSSLRPLSPAVSQRLGLHTLLLFYCCFTVALREQRQTPFQGAQHSAPKSQNPPTATVRLLLPPSRIPPGPRSLLRKDLCCLKRGW